MKHQPIRILSVLLALILAFSSLPLSVISENITSSQDENQVIFDQNFTTETTDESDNIFIVQEDTTKRGEFEKHYICSDGTYVVASYAEAIHYKDDNGEWIDVDNRPMQTTAGDYTTRNGDFGISVPSSAGDGPLMRMEKGEHSLSWTLSANKKAGTIKMDSNVSTMAEKPVQSQKMQVSTTQRPEIITFNAEQPHENHKILRDEATFDLPNVSGKVRYNDLFGTDEGISVVYTTYRNKIEEDIYIEKPTDITSFSMEVEAPNLTPRLNADNSVDFLDNDGKMCYHVGIPYMMDADFVILNDIETTVTRLGDVWVITYTPDAEWFTSEERVYPIMLDPSITTKDYFSNIQDTYVEENSTTNNTDKQHLYITANGNNKRNSVVRITKLPIIDESMPIISAKLTLTAEYAPVSDVALKASYTDSGFELDEYNYSLATEQSFAYTVYSYLNVGLTTVTFDVSSHIYEMYDDEEYDKEHGYDYHGDFIIGYANSGDTTFAYPFFSADYATHTNQPVFTVKYGYTLPAGILDGEVYSFQNCGSYSYMTVNGSEPANNSNVYQVWNDHNIATTTQKFKLEYVPSTGGYLLRAMSSSSGNNKVIDIQRSGGAIYSGRNVQIYSATDPISQEWLIVPVDYDVFRIVPRANMSLALTAYGYDDGTNSGKTSTSPGNIFVQTLANNNSFQQWYIYDNDDDVISTQQFRATIETDNYFLGNNFTGRYLHRNGNVVNGMSGRISLLGEETVKWRIVNLGDGYCTIQRSDTPHYYLAPTGTTSGSGVRVYSSVSETIPENYKWSIRFASGGGCIIQHKTSGLYLSGVSSTANPSTVCIYALNTPGTDAYSKQVWRVANEDYYVELGVAASFNDIDIDVGETKSASVKKSPSDASWAAYSDFDYTITSGGDYVSYDATTHKFTGIKRGTENDTYPIMVSVTATHKATGLTDTFDIKVNKNAIIIIPGFMGSELYIGNDNPYFKFNTPIVSQDMLNNLAEIGGNISTIEIIALVSAYLLSPATQTATNISATVFVNMFYDSIKCNDDGSSKYEIYTKKYIYVQPTYAADDPNKDNPIYTLPNEYDDRYYTPHAGLDDAYYELIHSLKENTDITSQYSIEFFSYDWRLSNAVSADRLNSFINEYGYDKVILLAHSMGGLVASGYMAKGSEQLNKVEEVYMLSSPLEGVPEVINIWANEDFSFLTGGDYEGAISFGSALLSIMTLSTNPIQKLLGNYASVYEVLPTQYYLSISPTPYLTYSTGSSTETVCSTYDASMDILSGFLPHFNSELMSDAEAFHASCRINNRHITYGVNCKYLYAIANNHDTTIQLKYTESLLGGKIEVKPTSPAGDSLVPSWSATLGRSGNNVIPYSGGHRYVISNTIPIHNIIDGITGGDT